MKMSNALKLRYNIILLRKMVGEMTTSQLESKESITDMDFDLRDTFWPQLLSYAA